MLTYITSNEYKELLGTQSIPSNFNNLVIEASNYINYETMGRIDINNIPEKVKYVTCLIINLIDERESNLKDAGNLKSQNIEGWSETFSTPEEIKTDYSNKMQSVLNTYLWDVYDKYGTPLLYKGVGTIE